MPHLRAQTLKRLHSSIGHKCVGAPPTLARYQERRAVSHLVLAGEHDIARQELLQPEVLLGLQRHPDLWPTVFPLGHGLWGEAFSNNLAACAHTALRESSKQAEAFVDVVGEILRGLGAHQEGLALASQSHEHRVAKHGENHPETHLSRHNLALAFEATGDLESAETLAWAALNGFESSSPPQLEFALQTRSTLAMILIAASRSAEAVDLLSNRIEDMGSSAGNNLAAALRTAGRIEEAREAYGKVIEARSESLGAHHPSTDSARVGLADTLRASQKYTDAAALYQEVIQRLESTLGPRHAQTEGALNGMSVCAFNMGDLDTAGALFERLLDSRSRQLGAHHPKTIMTLHNLGHLRLQQGDLSSAQACFEKVHEADRVNLGADHMDTAMSASALADVRAAQGDLDGAMTLWQQAADTMERVLGVEHPHAAQAVATIGIGLCGAGKTEDALPYLERSVAMMTAGTGGPAKRAWTKTNLAVALERVDLFTRAMVTVSALIDDHVEAENDEQAEKAREWLAELETKI